MRGSESDGLHPIPARKQETLGFLRRRQRAHRWLGREIRTRVRGILGVRRGAWPRTTVGRLDRFPWRALRLGDHREGREQRGGGERGPSGSRVRMIALIDWFEPHGLM